MRADSPEDRLLRLIKGKHQKSDAKEISSFDKKPSFALFAKKIFLKSKIFKPSFLKSINKALAATLIILVIYFVSGFLIPPYKNIGYIIQEEGASPVGTVPEEKPISSRVEDYSVYSKSIEGKELFSAPIAEGPGEPASSEIDVSKRFNLVGIIAGDQPQAIIEDKETQKTYYLYKGQSFSGVTVQEIGEGKVTLSYKGREISLVL